MSDVIMSNNQMSNRTPEVAILHLISLAKSQEFVFLVVSKK